MIKGERWKHERWKYVLVVIDGIILYTPMVPKLTSIRTVAIYIIKKFNYYGYTTGTNKWNGNYNCVTTLTLGCTMVWNGCPIPSY